MNSPPREKYGKSPTDSRSPFRKNRSHPIRKNDLCEHERLKNLCKEFGTCYCEHGRVKSRCSKCKQIINSRSPFRKNRSRPIKKKYLCKQSKDCGTGFCKHGRQKHRCKIVELDIVSMED